MLVDEVTNLRVYDVAPTPACEDAVVSAFLRGEMPAHRFRQAGAQLVSRTRLAIARNIVELTLDREQCRLLDVLRTHEGAVDFPGPLGQPEFLEHDANRLEIV